MTNTLSPQGYYYKFDMDAPAGRRLVRKRHLEQSWHPEFSVQMMSADELRFVAGIIDEARSTGRG